MSYIKFTDKMPPDTDQEILIRKINEKSSTLTPANEIWFDISRDEIDLWEWIPTGDGDICGKCKFWDKSKEFTTPFNKTECANPNSVYRTVYFNIKLNCGLYE